jgi:hypothetical protein
MENRSGLLKAGTILLLVGGILRAVGAVLIVLYGTVVSAVFDALAKRNAAAASLPPYVAVLFLVLGVLVGVGSLFSLLGYGRAKAGDPHSAFVRGLVGALLPPVQVVSLVGAILCKVSPEGEGRAPAPPQAPAAWPPR